MQLGTDQGSVGLAQAVMSPGCTLGILSMLSPGSSAALLAPAPPCILTRRMGEAAWSVQPEITGATALASPHVPVGKGHLHAEHHQRLGAIVPLPSQEPALAQCGGQALPGAGAAPALAIPLAGLAAPRRGSVPGQRPGPADGDGAEKGWGTPSSSLHLCEHREQGDLCRSPQCGCIHSGLPGWCPPDSPERIRQDIAPIEGVDGALQGGAGLTLKEGAPGLGQELPLWAQAAALS